MGKRLLAVVTWPNLPELLCVNKSAYNKISNTNKTSFLQSKERAQYVQDSSLNVNKIELCTRKMNYTRRECQWTWVSRWDLCHIHHQFYSRQVLELRWWWIWVITINNYQTPRRINVVEFHVYWKKGGMNNARVGLREVLGVGAALTFTSTGQLEGGLCK